ncbi:MAG: 7,8-didemethyl-8-hydroxy-5-deazariboflavin synthase [Chloroflexi bacterium]|nr:7,8-didemethyl-8-hydroxy-5-deazariboflavin synthase [Chloroflexota bacterium]
MGNIKQSIAKKLLNNEKISLLEAYDLIDLDTDTNIFKLASSIRDHGFGNTVTYSKKVFIPLTKLCRDVCHYCTFAQPPQPGENAYLRPEEVLEIARQGKAAGCHEALFTLGDKPELRYPSVREELALLGYATTIDYLIAMAELVFQETGLLPHANPGVMSREDMIKLRAVSPSQGIMLETISNRLSEKNMPHFGSPDKDPVKRLNTIRLAGELKIPFTSGILIGIGETRKERIDSLFALRELNDEYEHIQEIIIQNFRAKPGTKMASAPEPDLDDLLWTIAITRFIFGHTMSIQAPPNLTPHIFNQLIHAGLNDWGGVSPITPDYVNPEAPWPELIELSERSAQQGKVLVERLTVYPKYIHTSEEWVDKKFWQPIFNTIDTEGLVRSDSWSPGDELSNPPASLTPDQNGIWPLDGLTGTNEVTNILEKISQKIELTEAEIIRLFQARGDDIAKINEEANKLRKHVSGDIVTYVVNRNINYTNICYFKCQFCAFSKGKLAENLRGTPYDLDLEEIATRTQEAWERGATEVCMQGGIHPDYTGSTYLEILETVKSVQPNMHVHAFSPLEVWQGAATLGIPLKIYLTQLHAAGLGSLPGTAAEILDDEVRKNLCPDKVNTEQWLHVMETAHSIGLPSTATIMYGHIEQTKHWARHLLRIKKLQQKTGGFTEFVPLPFVHMEAPIYLKGRARKGPTYREAILMHSVSRLVLHPDIKNIQVSWVKMGPNGIRASLLAGVNDLGGTLMNESITRSAGGEFGEELSPEKMDHIIDSIGRKPQQRTTKYVNSKDDQISRSYGTSPLPKRTVKASKNWLRKTDQMLIRPGFEKEVLDPHR